MGKLQLLKKCLNMRQLKKVHAQIISSGLGEDSFLISRILDFCSNPSIGSVDHARRLFRQTKHPTLCIFNTMMKTLLLNGEYDQMVDIYRQMMQGEIFPDNYTYPYLLKGVIYLKEDLKPGVQVHGSVVKFGFDCDVFVANTLVLMYCAWGKLHDARQMFEGIPQRDAASWTILISGYAKEGEIEIARGLFDRCSLLRDHGIWGSVISGYVQNNCFKESLAMFREMQLAGVKADEGILVSVLSACAQLGAMDIGLWIHRYIRRTFLAPTVHLSTALIDMYMKSGDPVRACKLFNGMPKRDNISWNVMISGLATNGDGLGALKLFDRMQKEGFSPDGSTFLAALSACSHSGLVQEGLRLFYLMKTVYGIEPQEEHYTYVVGFLGRAGLLHQAQEVLAVMSPSSGNSEAIALRSLLSATWQHEAHTPYVNLSNEDEAKRLVKELRACKMPGCSSVEVNGFVQEFVAGDGAHMDMSKVYEVLQAFTRHHSEIII